TRRARVEGSVRRLVAVLHAEGAPVPDELSDLVDAPFGWRLFLGRYDLDRLAGPTGPGRPRAGAPWVVTPDGAAPVLVGHGQLWVVRPLVDALLGLLDGDEVELEHRLAGSRRLLPTSPVVFPGGWWPGWKDRALDDLTHGEGYRRWIHPPLAEVLAALSGPLDVLDLGGGDGDALALCPQVGRAVVVDQDAAMVAAARARFAGRDVEGVALAVDGTTDLVAVCGGQVDLVVAMGLLCVNVMDAPTARAVLARIAEVVRPGGWCVLTGWTPSLVGSDDLEACGFEVRNRVAPGREGEEAWGHGLFVGRRCAAAHTPRQNVQRSSTSGRPSVPSADTSRVDVPDLRQRTQT
ncbi:MAG: class I SAM-dependent methyltransferase, partial [Myxococcales bacterium]|nr:class I SAM-dependent methyltransferase [Myxococcales bacterium]